MNRILYLSQFNLIQAVEKVEDNGDRLLIAASGGAPTELLAASKMPCLAIWSLVFHKRK
jgi:hypothetical protein